MKYFYITTPIYYVNSAPHIGTLYTTLASDVVARFKRLDGYTVKFVTGTDEHGQKIERSAKDNGAASPQEFVDQMSAKFADLFKQANIAEDDFIRTTQNRHKNAVTALWNKLKENGHIYLGKYAGWYSVSDEAFFAESEIVDGKAPTGSKVEWVSEESYFFDLSKWQHKLLKLYEDNPDFITPKWRANEVINMVKAGLPDLSISRTTFKWGIPVPNDDKHIIYVWLDALANYLTVLGYPDQTTDDFKNFWPVDAHVVGKDIIKFHAIYWPAMLMAAGLALPKKIVAHGWWIVRGQKMSKSLKNVVDPREMMEKYGVDTVRYYLMREIPFGSDGEFSEENLVLRSNTELANKIGNLLQRTLVLAYKNCDQKIPTFNESDVKNLYNQSEILQSIGTLLENIRNDMENFRISQSIEHILEFADRLNNYIDVQAPWKLAKTDHTKMRQVLYVVLEAMRYIGILMLPFVPTSASRMLDQLAIPNNLRSLDKLNAEFALKSSTLEMPQPIFPRIELT